jgi:exopolyphosphatase/guanosine-5'-triphosphate,3'-diphosphate pyrophosphatase
VALIALLARAHRKGAPDTSAYKVLLNQADSMVLTQLAAILRLAEFLERGRSATIDDIAVTWDDSTLHLTLIADEYPAVELWEAERMAVGLMETAFRRRVVLHTTAAPNGWLVT